ncbi:DUF397 domain-containing protein [Streptomyces phaeolivaceus]|uniref:DUF397 domain-containing protein n=1 Tax=Streptomyces phaeolivaceus TaxID=2653200 RepID=A0A5P8K617_9ACTN|nr:DUF397 domain-containing protein [Streptomyces phaeolivaceus]QFQ98446.1 DUF397 domain-containing protein [Streptomyces phaeolivaceus]
MPDIPPNLDWIRAAPEDATGPGPWIELAFGEGNGEDDPEAPVYIRETSDPDNVVTTNRRKWDAFVLGVQAGEFDHFVEGVEGFEPTVSERKGQGDDAGPTGQE